MIPILAVATGLIGNLEIGLIVIICLLVLWWIGKSLLTTFESPPAGFKIWNALFILLGGLALINFLLSLIDKPFIPW